MEDWKEKLREILKGIDEEETHSNDGWWETSEGRQLGERKLLEVEEFIEQEIGKAREEGRREGGQAFLRDTLSYCSFHNGKPRRLGDVEIVARKLSKLKDNK